MKYITKELNNISAVAYNTMKERDSVSLGVWIRTGSRYEEDDKSGISHFIEHLVFRGTKNYTANQITRSIEGIGGELNAFTGEEYTCYFVKVRRNFLDVAFNVLSDMVLYPNLSLKDIKREKNIITEEIKMYLDIPMKAVHNMVGAILWKNHPLGRMISGTVDTVNSLSKQDFSDYKRKYYNSNNVVVVACGAVTYGELADLIDKYFPDTPLGKKSQFAITDIAQTAPQLNLQEKETQQTHITIGSRALHRDHPDSLVLSLLNIIIGGNMSSRLFNEVREKRGLAYGINSRVIRYIDTGALVIYAGIKHENLLEVIKIISQQLAKIKDEIPSEEEIKRAKEYYKGQMLLMLEETASNMLWFGERVVTESEIKDPAQLLNTVDKITPERISQLASDVFKNNNMNLAAIGANLNKQDEKITNILNDI